jgi:fatty-acid desaturase
MENKFLVWLRKNQWMVTLLSIIIAILYFIICVFLGHLIQDYLFNKYPGILYGLFIMILLQYPLLKTINKYDMKYKISKPYQDKKCNCKDCNCKDG